MRQIQPSYEVLGRKIAFALLAAVQLRNTEPECLCGVFERTRLSRTVEQRRQAEVCCPPFRLTKSSYEVQGRARFHPRPRERALHQVPDNTP